MNPHSSAADNSAEAVATRISGFSNDGMPSTADWQRARPVTFCADWQGKNADPERQTEVRMLWSDELLFLRFECRYRTVDVFEDSEPDGYRDQLWDRDVAEVFIQPDRFGSRQYTEFEVAPNGMWIDLEIFPGGHNRLRSGLRRKVQLDEAARLWTAEIAIPLLSVSSSFAPDQIWRVNFFRCEGRDPNRFYSSWRATGTPNPNFHVPDAFGQLRFME